MSHKIILTIDCADKTCGDCQYKRIFKTGLVGEFHPGCELFPGYYGRWGERDMKRSRQCIAAQKKAERPGAKHRGASAGMLG